MAISYIGTTISVVAATPATEDDTGYSALSWTEIGKVVSLSELGDTVEDIAFNLLKGGRTKHVNGTKDVGDITGTYEYDSADAGQVILRSGAGSNTVHSLKVEDTDGNIKYLQGVVADVRDYERVANQYKGQTFIFRGQSGFTETTP